MWRENNLWLHYVKNIMAADLTSAMFLVSFLRRTQINKTYAAALEIIDLQKYKVIRQEHKVKSALRERANVPFVFVACKN